MTGKRSVNVDEFVDGSDDVCRMDDWLECAALGGVEGVRKLAQLVQWAGSDLDLSDEFVCFDCCEKPLSYDRQELMEEIAAGCSTDGRSHLGRRSHPVDPRGKAGKKGSQMKAFDDVAGRPVETGTTMDELVDARNDIWRTSEWVESVGLGDIGELRKFARFAEWNGWGVDLDAEFVVLDDFGTPCSYGREELLAEIEACW